jgi:membrane protein
MAAESKSLSLKPYSNNARSSWLVLRDLPRVSRLASTEWVNDNGPRLAASVAFYVLLFLAPVIVIAVTMAAVIYGQEGAQTRLAAEVQGMAGPFVAGAIQEIVKGAYKPRTGAIATLLGLAALSFGASSVFVELHDAMNTIWGVPPPRDRNHSATVVRLIMDRFYSFAAVLGIGFVLLLAVVSNAWIAAMRIAIPRAVTLLVLYLIIGALFAALYKIVPDVRLQWSDVALGALIASLLFLAATQFIGLYFAHTSLGSTYSAAGAPIVVLLWVYYSAQVFFWGAEFGKAYRTIVGSQRRPD